MEPIPDRSLELDTLANPLTPSVQCELEALRIQAAAVAAQQAALIEEEHRLQQRRVEVEQQETQLAGHLEEKRRRLTELQDQIRAERDALQEERSRNERAAQESAAARAEVADGLKQNDRRRQRLIRLQARLKQRLHRHWSVERQSMRQREDALGALFADLAAERDRLRQEKDALFRDRCRLNGQREIDRCKVQDERAKQHHVQQNLDEKLKELKDRACRLELLKTAVRQAEERLAEAERHGTKKCRDLEKEAEGLENRILNKREMLLELQGSARTGGHGDRAAETPAVSVSPPPHVALMQFDMDPQSLGQNRPATVSEPETEAVAAWRLQAMENLAGQLADQRAQLLEQWERLLRTQESWRQDQAWELTELELLGRRLQQRELALETAEGQLLIRQDEARRLRNSLENWQARLALRTTALESERDRWQAELGSREELMESRLAIVGGLRRRWFRQHRQQMTHLKAEQLECDELRQEYVRLRRDLLDRQATLEEAQRRLAEQSLALENDRQTHLAQGGKPRTAAKRLERLRRHWVTVFAEVGRNLVQERQTLDEAP